jgi:hypothetical protein
MSKLMPIFSKVAATGVDLAASVDVTEESTTAGDGSAGGGTMMFNLVTDVFGFIGDSEYYHYAGSLTTPGAPPDGCVHSARPSAPRARAC